MMMRMTTICLILRIFSKHFKFLSPTVSELQLIFFPILKKESTMEIECSICFETATDFVTECKHSFHETCLKKWAETGKTTCPLCRQQIAPIHEENGYDSEDDGNNYDSEGNEINNNSEGNGNENDSEDDENHSDYGDSENGSENGSENSDYDGNENREDGENWVEAYEDLYFMEFN